MTNLLLLLISTLFMLIIQMIHAQQFLFQSSLIQYDNNIETAAAAAAASASTSEQYAHPSVLENARREAELPSGLLKSTRFYQDPYIAAVLAKNSWFTDKEMPVLDRETDKIPRTMIYKLLKNAGLETFNK